jgi:hypothetical protein
MTVQPDMSLAPHGRGRPSSYSDEIARAICDRIADGETIRSICADPGMPAKATVFRWRDRHKEFREHYAIARELLLDDLLFQMVEVADDSSGDYVQKTRADGKVVWVEDKANLARSRLKLKTLEAVVARMMPRKYGKR